jgi:molecular chaperone GrpE
MPRKKNATEDEKMPETNTDQPEAVAPTEITTETGEARAETSDIEQLQAELEQAQAKANEYLDGWQRAMAEFANYKKRIEREQALNQNMAKANVIKRFLEIFDDLERAAKNLPGSGDAAGWIEGIDLINRKFLTYLQNEGVEPIETEGQFFDPNLHEAISQEDHAELESGQIIGVVQKGYRLGERILRPARVRVAR